MQAFFQQQKILIIFERYGKNKDFWVFRKKKVLPLSDLWVKFFNYILYLLIKEIISIVERSRLAGAVPQTALLLIHCFIKSVSDCFLKKSSKHLFSQAVSARDLTFWENIPTTPLLVICQMSCVTCHESRVTCNF